MVPLKQMLKKIHTQYVMFLLNTECKTKMTNDKKKSFLNNFDNFNKVIDNIIKNSLLNLNINMKK